MHWTGPVCLFSLLLFEAGVACPAESGGVSESQNPYSVAVEVDLVVVPVAVWDNTGSPVDGLPRADFRVFEDGVPQEILQFDNRDTPAALGLLLDNSGSMRTKLVEVAAAAAELAKGSNPLDQVFVIHFNEDVEFGLPVGESFTSNLADLERAVRRTAPAGLTALYDAIIAGLEHLQESSLPRKALVVISDGGDNASHHSLVQTEHLAGSSDSLIYAISIADENSEEPRPGILKRLARESGGIFFQPRTVSALPQVSRHIAEDLRTQYTLSYASTNRKRDGTYRKIRVDVETPGGGRLHVRTRRGYIAPLDR